MKKTIYLSLLAGCLATLASCEGSDYEVDNLFPEQYHKILYASKSGKQTVPLYNVEEPETYTFSVIKSGSAPTLTAGADIRVMTQEEIDSKYSKLEGINYKILGSNAYTIDVNHVDFESSDKFKLVNVTLNPQAVKAAIESANNTSWILPLCISSNTDSVNVNKNELILQFPAVVTPTIGFDKAGLDLTEYAYGRVPSIEKVIPFLLDANNKWEIDCQFGLSQDYINTYNQVNGTYFQMLPEGTYSFADRGSLIKPNKQADLTVKVNGGNLPPGDFMLPIQVQNVSLFAVSPTKNVYAMAFRITAPMLDRTGWTVEANTEELTGELGNHNSGPADRILDGKEESFWHSAWTNSTSIPLPHELVIDTKKEHTFTQIRLVHRQQYAYVKSGEFYISSDKANWEKVGNFTMPNTLGSAQTFGIKSTKGKYIKIKITSSNNATNSTLAEIYAYGV